MKGSYATIIKDGKLITIEEDDLNRGDMVLVQAGDHVPADINLLEARNLEVDEFELTGELLPVTKTVHDDEGVLLMGSRITRGTGKGIVVAVGEGTEHGGILQQAWGKNKSFTFQIFKRKYLILVLLLLPALAVNLVQSNNSIPVIGVYLLMATIFILLQNDDLFMQFLVSKEIKNCETLHINIRDENIFKRYMILISYVSTRPEF